MRVKHRMRVICLIAILSGVSSCATNTGGSDCIVFSPIYFSDDDTEETITQVLDHNAAWESICE